MSNPVPPSTISTPRLHLVRLTDPSPGSQHLQWFHENWSDPIATSWRYRPHLPTPTSPSVKTHPLPLLLALKHQSLHGATKSLEESRVWMLDHLTKWDNWFYAVFQRDSTHPAAAAADDDPGVHIGSVSLRRNPAGPELAPPLPAILAGAEQVGAGAPLTEEQVRLREVELQRVRLDVRVLGYALFAPAQGKGFATEACRALLDAYAASIGEWKGRVEGRVDGGKTTVFYVEAGVDQDNPGSQRVLRKLGFRTVGMKIEKEKAWLNGGWRGPGWWITGMYL